MSRPSVLWRAVLRTERAMPWTPAVSAPAVDAAAGRRAQRWALVAAMVPAWSIALVQLIGHRAALAGAWPTWRPMLLDLMLLAGGAALVAALAFGAVAYRRTRAAPHA